MRFIRQSTIGSGATSAVDSSRGRALLAAGAAALLALTALIVTGAGQDARAAEAAVLPTLTLTASPSGSQTRPGDVVLTATLSGASPDDVGEQILFTVNGAAFTATTDAAGIATHTVASPPAGEYSFGASFAGNELSSGAVASPIAGYTVQLAPQSISLVGLDAAYTYGDGPIEVSVNGGPGTGAVTYASTNLPVASVSGSTVTIHQAGQFTLTATKAADDTYAAATGAEVTAIVDMATPVVSVSLSGGADANDPILVTAAVSGVPGGKMPGGTVSFFREDSTSPGAESLGMVSVDSDGVAKVDVGVAAVGSYVYWATFDGEADHYTRATSPDVPLTVGLERQEPLVIGDPGPRTYGDAPFALSTTGGSGNGAVTYASSDPTVASVSGSTVTIHRAGEFRLTATKAADAPYGSATSAPVTVTVDPRDIALADAAATGAPFIFTGAAIQPGVEVSDGSIPIDAADYALAYGSNVDVGPAAASATLTGRRNYTGTLAIAFAIGFNQAQQTAIDLITGLPDPIATAAEADAVAAATNARDALTDAEQRQIPAQTADALATAQDEAAAVNHTAPGGTAGGEAPWYLRLNIVPIADSDVRWADFAASLEDGRLLALFDITLTNTLTGERWQPPAGTTVSITLTELPIAGEPSVGLWHRGADGAVQSVAVTIEGPTATFAGASFSLYGISAAAPGDGSEPPADEPEPAADGTAPPAGGSAPTAGGTAPRVDGSAPGADGSHAGSGSLAATGASTARPLLVGALALLLGAGLLLAVRLRSRGRSA